MAKKLGYQLIVPHLKTLRYFGIYRLNPKSPILYRFLYRVYMLIILLFQIVYPIQEIIYIFNVREDFDKVLITMYLFLTYTDSILKQIVIIFKEDEIQELVAIQKGSLFNYDDPKRNEILLKSHKLSYVLLRVYNFLTLFTCTLWIIFPTISHLQGRPVEFPFWLPFSTDKHLPFFAVLLYSYISTCVLGMVNSTMDCFITIFLFQCKIQITILRRELENLVIKSKNETETSSSFADTLRNNFHKIILHYDEIIKVSKKCKDIFGGVVFYQFLISSWIVCTTVYRMADLNLLSLEFFSLVIYVNCILIQLYIYCYFGNELTYESLKLLDSAYAMNWTDTPLTHRRSLIIFMERIKMAIEPKAIIIPLSTSTFVSILRSSYSFYAFLRNSK